MRSRNKSVPASVFIKGWNQGVRAGKSLDEIAESLEMEPSSASVAASQRRKKLGYYDIVNGKPVAKGHDEEGEPIEGEHLYVLELQRGGGGRALDLDDLRNAAIEAAGELETAGAK